MGELLGSLFGTERTTSRPKPIGADTATKAHCPFCGRTEEIEDWRGENAWLNGHIIIEHEDELPPLAGCGDD